MRKLLIAAAAFALLAAPASAQTLVLGTGVFGGTQAQAGSQSSSGSGAAILGFGANQQSNTTTSFGTTALGVNGGLTQSGIAGASTAGTNSTSNGGSLAIGGAIAGGTSSGLGTGTGQSTGFGGFGFTFP